MSASDSRAAAESRCAARMEGHREVKNGAPWQIGGHPQPASMRFDDRAADRQPHPQTAGLGRMERGEELLETRRAQAWPCVLYRDQHAVRFGFSGGDGQLSRPFRVGGHCLDSVDNDVEGYLLQLYAISFDER